MIIKNGTNSDISRMDLGQTRASQGVGGGSTSSTGQVQQNASSDSISLSTPGDIVQQALTAGASDRAARIQQLKSLIDNNQYQVDAQATSRAIIDAHVAGD